MSQLLAVVLVCASTLAPDQCNTDTATDIAAQPATSEISCLLEGQALIAGGAIGQALTPESYLKIMCARRLPRPAGGAPAEREASR